jgi:hypothetical protein
MVAQAVAVDPVAVDHAEVAAALELYHNITADPTEVMAEHMAAVADLVIIVVLLVELAAAVLFVSFGQVLLDNFQQLQLVHHNLIYL